MIISFWTVMCSLFHSSILLSFKNMIYFFKGVIFSLNTCWGTPFLLAVIVLVVIVAFALFGSPRESGLCSFRGFYINPIFRKHNCLVQMIDNHQKCFFFTTITPHGRVLFNSFNEDDGKSSNMCFFLICLPPGRRLLLTPGIGMGGWWWWWGGFGTILG